MMTRFILSFHKSTIVVLHSNGANATVVLFLFYSQAHKKLQNRATRDVKTSDTTIATIRYYLYFASCCK